MTARLRTLIMVAAATGLLLVALLTFNTARERGAAARLAGYSVQLVRAENADHPKGNSFKPVAERLRAQLGRIFQWQQYWEVSRRQVPAPDGSVTKVRLSSECEVEIESVSPTVRETRIYINGVLSSRSRSHTERDSPDISGRDLDDGSAWFVIVEEEWEAESRKQLVLKRADARDGQ